MIECYAIKKSYNSLEVLKGIDLKIEEGKVVSIVGASGAGKSTLLNILGTLDTAESGHVFLDNQEVSKLKGRNLARFRNRNIGFIFQFHHLLPEFTVLENIAMPAYIGGFSESKIKKETIELMERLGLDNKVKNKPSELSGGEQQRTAVARALINKPKVVFADEPSGNLDSKNAEALHKLFFELRDELNQTFVIVTHNKELANMADTKLEIEDGYLKA